MHASLVLLVVGSQPPWPTGQERIASLWDALKWRVGSVPGLDAAVNSDGGVFLFRRR